jgi:hypothetical protein
MVSRLKTFWHFGMPFSEVAGAVACSAKKVGVKFLGDFGSGGIGISRGAKAASVKACQDCLSADPADRVADKAILETRSLGCEPVNVRSLNNGIPVATNRAGRLIVGKEKDYVGSVVSKADAEAEKGECEKSEMFHLTELGIVANPDKPFPLNRYRITPFWKREPRFPGEEDQLFDQELIL